jgi:hypothetical protein
MNCIKCDSDRILSLSGKTSDCYNHQFKGREYDGYVPEDLGIGGGDYIEFAFCLECGQIQDTFPKDNPKSRRR